VLRLYGMRQHQMTSDTSLLAEVRQGGPCICTATVTVHAVAAVVTAACFSFTTAFDPKPCYDGYPVQEPMM
jgi:hypothetical protein